MADPGTLPASDDYSRMFAALRPKLVDASGEAYLHFVRRLKPKYWMVYRDLSAGYILLAASLGLTVAAPRWGVPPLAASAAGAIFMGYWIAYLLLFLHEGAHYNLAASRAANDRICNAAVSWLIGTTVAAYRPVHFAHHRELGTMRDTEFTYFFPLDLMFLLKAAFGIRALEVMLNRNATGVQSERQNDRARASKIGPMLVGVAAHGAIIVGPVLLGWWWAALAWVMAVILVFPFFGAVRQLLEHRADWADSGSDYRKQDHGPFTRIFDAGLFARSFGAAGFNRHLLHHWEPQLSYTNLREHEKFLAGTEINRIMDLRRSTYFRTFVRLLAQA